MPFVNAYLEIFHCTHHPVIPMSDLYFTFCSTLNEFSVRNTKVTVNCFGKWNGMNRSKPLNGCEINVRFCFAKYIKAGMYYVLLRSVSVH